MDQYERRTGAGLDVIGIDSADYDALADLRVGHVHFSN